MLHACVELGLCVFCLCCMRSSNPLLKLDTAQYRHSCHFSQVTLLPLSPMPPSLLFSSHPLSSSSLHLICSPSFTRFPLPLCSFCLLLCTLPPPPPSAFDDLSQAHPGEYSKGGYGGSAQSQAKSAGSGPGKGTHTTHARTI